MTLTFNPPEVGLKPGENVVWARKRGTGFFLIFFSMMLGIGGTVGTVNAFAFVGLVLALPLLVLMAVGFCLILRAFMKGRGTKYYLTNQRLIEARKGQIAKEISLERFQGKSLNQFFEKKVTYTENNQPVYVFKICDPLSGDTLMEFKNLDPDSVEALERIGQVTECRYCGFKNSANSLKCNNCGGPL